MRIAIQPSAVRDLREGFRFYEGKEAGLGSYFLDSLSTDIESLRLRRDPKWIARKLNGLA